MSHALQQSVYDLKYHDLILYQAVMIKIRHCET